ncbi:hypothetical protein EDM02_03285 [Candidatus Cardinium hertigii]|jgi:hypothetical protein|uniref:Uncharacterized protein n=1 Tax=Candidatus Cardinium hertigii TaxID=247481 RepID=A0A3N2QBQ3_9BACT|nr:hypothetical protein EDM02_03510 [Candidatus Cardinium hertigii]ROT47210.1 hypothetical protein EDM02_03575 [Candidatus Cardinium hertigii]ROT47426.1 hypothetical protein EDM02_03285 [Candidatus Cardinium hertigii]
MSKKLFLILGILVGGVPLVWYAIPDQQRSKLKGVLYNRMQHVFLVTVTKYLLKNLVRNAVKTYLS